MLFGFQGFSQNPDRKFVGYEVIDNKVVVKTNDGRYRFMAYTPEIFETSFIPEGENFDTISHAVILDPGDLNLNVSEDNSSVLIDSEGIDVKITKQPFQISYFYNDSLVISEEKGYSRGEELQKIHFNLKEDEMLFGGGARVLGMNRRGKKLRLYNQAHYGYEAESELLNFTLPIVFSSAKYLLHFDNAPIGFLDLDSEKNNRLGYETIGGRKTYQLVVGNSWEEIVSNYTLLTGRQPMPPRWALGNFSSRFGYHSQREVLETIEKFKQDNIPVDAVILDLYWFGHEIKGTMGNLEFVRDSFPDPEQMMEKLAQQGVKTILVTEPFILTTSKKWEEAVAEEVLATDKAGKPFKYDFYFGNTGLIDIFKPKAQDWFWNIYASLIEMGVDGWWGDLGEPEVHPYDLQHVAGSADEVHNIYGHYWAKMIYDGYQKNYSATRPFILMRAGAAGSQRFGLIPWSGDVSRSWGGLQSQPEISLQMGVQGLAYMHSDLGGFAGNLLDNELYARWLQYGVFQPVFRPHAQEEVASEPVFKEPETKALAKQAIELRYRLLPYNYTLTFKNSQSGIPLMRPLFFEEPDNANVYPIANTYLWGNNFLVSPVMAPGITEKEVYFPKNSTWYDFYTGKSFKGGSSYNIELNKGHIPTFVRGGAFIPMAKPIQTTVNYNPEVLEVHYYFDRDIKKTEGLVYNDDGITPQAYEKGKYELLEFSSSLTGNALSIEVNRDLGIDFEPQIEVVELFIQNLKMPVKFVWVNGIKYTGKNYMHQGNLIIPISLREEASTIKIEFN